MLAMGCTEPIAVAYGAAKARKLLGKEPNCVKIYASGNMSGCELPVIINSGGGNQGITGSVPVMEYTKTYHIAEDKL